MINDLKYINGVLYQLPRLSKQWVPVPGQERKPDAVRITEDGEKYVYFGNPLPHHGGKSRVQELLIREAQIAVLKEQLASAEADARIKGANLEQARKERDVAQAQAKELCDKVDYWKRVAAGRKERGNALAEMLHAERAKVRGLRSALAQMVNLANCFIPADRTNSIVDNAIKVLQDTK